MKRKILAVSLVVIVLATLTIGTLAFFTDEDTAHNVFTSGEVDIVLEEFSDAECKTPFVDLSGAMPDTTVGKYARITLAEGSADAWLRVQFKKSIALNEENPDAAGKTADPDLLVLGLPAEGWTDGGDGWYYYDKVLTKDEPRAMALNSVYFSKEMGNEYQGATATVTVIVQAVQKDYNSSTVQEAKGWPALDEETSE